MFSYLEPAGETAEQLDFDGQADERGHAAVGDGGCELDVHGALAIIDLQTKHSSLVRGLGSEGTGLLFSVHLAKGWRSCLLSLALAPRR